MSRSGGTDWVKRVLGGVRALLARKRLDADLDDELRLHIELETEKNVRAGMDPAEARRRALVAFGGVERYREAARDARGVRPLLDLWRDIRYAVRALKRTPAASILAVLTLALAIGAGTTTYSVVSGAVLRSLPFREPGRLVNVRVAPARLPYRGWGATTSLTSAKLILSATDAFQKAAPFYGEQPVLRGIGDPVRVDAWRVAPDFFPVLGEAALLGRTLTADDADGAQDVAVISHRFWVSRLGSDPEVIGRTLTLNDRVYQVVGVMPPRFEYPADAQIWLPARPLVHAWGLDVTKLPAGRPQGGYWLVARLAPGLTLDQAFKRANARFQAYAREDSLYGTWHPTLQPLSKFIAGEVRKPLLLLLAAVALVLLIACANVAAVLLARGVTRRRELAIRLSLGAGRGRVLRQLLTEALVLALLSGALGILLSLWAVPAVVSLVGNRLPRVAEIGLNWGVLGVAVAAVVLTGLLAGALPALLAVRENASSALKDGATGTGASRWRLRMGEGLVVLQVALGTVLLAGGALLGLSFMKLIRVDYGFNPDHVAVAQLWLPGSRYDTLERRLAFIARTLEQARAIPGARAASVSTGIPLDGDAIGTMEVPDEPPPAPGTWAWFTEVTPDFFPVYGIRLVRGHGFPREGPAEPGAVLVNESFVRAYFHGDDPLGRTVSYFDGRVKGRIIGVVSDARQDSLEAAPTPQLYDTFAGANTGNHFSIAVRTAGDVAGTTAALTRAIHAVDPLLAIDRVVPMNDLVMQSVARRRLYAVILTAFSLIALLITALGMYGLTAYTVRSRTREIGVRMALGATQSHVRAVTVGRTASLAGAGVVLGLAGAVATTRLLTAFLFGLSATDPFVFGSVAVVLALVAAFAAVGPARRAAHVDPMVALRAD